MSIVSVMPSNHLILCRPLLSLPSMFPGIRESFPMSQFVASDGQSIGLRYGFSISPYNQCSGRISFRTDWLDPLAVQRTLKCLLQHHSSNASILQHSAFFMVQLSHPYMTTGKTMALTRWTFVSKVMSLLFNMLSRLIIAFLPRSKRLLISWLQSPSAVILEPKKIKSITVSVVSPSIFPEVMGSDTMVFFFEYWILSHDFHSPLYVHQEAHQLLFAFCDKDGVIDICDVMDISLNNLNSSLCFIQSDISHNVLCITVK